MTDTSTMKRRVILGGYAGAVLTGFSIICLAAFGRIAPEPALGIIAFVCGSVILAASAWRWTRRN